MKKYYYVLLFVIVAVVAVFSSPLGSKIETFSPAVQILAMLAFIVPVCLLLYFISKDERIKRGFRIAAKIGSVFLIVCYIGGVLAELL